MAKISLCLIVGNVEEYIVRCLTSFQPIADEIIVVRAIGNAPPDRTLEIARDQFGAITAEYQNAPGHADWPHVDNFAAARQKSFDLATGDYCFWCDTDDVLLSGAEVVRELADRGGYAAFVFPYAIFGKGLSVPRERMIAKGAGQWQFPVHECFNFHIQPVQAVEDNRVVVQHLPHLSKTGSNPRNLRILRSIPEAEMTTGLYYHLHLELALADDIAGSIEAAKTALARPDLGQPERYEIFLNLAQATESPQAKAALLHQAYAAAPARREALGLLANLALNFGSPEDGLAYARQMKATPEPSRVDWNTRAAVYGWVGDDIYGQALRANGRLAEAEALRKETLKAAGGARIALVHATRGRPEQAAMARKVWLDLAEQPDRVEHIFVIDADDKESEVLRRMHHLRLPPGGGCVAAWNHGCLATTAPVIVQLSDDWTPLPQWDKLILERLGDVTKPSVLAISDGIRADQLLCMAICTRAYYNADYFLFHPWFKGVYSDNWFTDEAYRRNAVIEARDLVFKHEHFLATGKAPDATYAAQNSAARYAEGQAIYERLQQRTDWSSVPGFFNYWNWYQFIAQTLKDGDTVAEIGVWQGRSLIYLAQELQRLGKRGVKLIAVDHFKGESNCAEHAETIKILGGDLRAEFQRNLERCGVSDMVTVIDGESAASAAQVPDGSLAFCYIDAAHDYASVKADLAAWTPKVRPGGILSGHDAQWPEVIRAVEETLGDKAKFLGPVWARL